MSLRTMLLKSFLFLAVAATWAMVARPSLGDEGGAGPNVDFSYAFATPHRITVGRPDASDRTLLDVQPGKLRMSWTYDNLSMPNYPPFAFRTPRTERSIRITPQIDGKPPAQSRWTRIDGVLPALENVYEDTSGSVRLEALGGMTAALVRIEVVNSDRQPHQVVLRCDSDMWGENLAWLDAVENAGDNLVAGSGDRADRVLILGLGADAYSLGADGLPPGARSMVLVWNVKPGQKRQGWIVRPYRSHAADLPTLRKQDWAGEMEQGKREWHALLGRASRLSIPDAGVAKAYLACLADLFIMREPDATGRIIGVPGTEGYRAGNSAEPLIISVALDQNGFHKESAAGLSTSFDMQEADGCWDDRRGWMHSMWCGSGFKAWAAMEHYRLTGDKRFLAEVYPRMLASSRWRERQRARSRTEAARQSLTYGLMPRGMGDCGLKDGNDVYGVFFPHNVWAVYADRCSLEAAELLGKTGDLAELKKIFDTARADLLAALDSGAIKEKDYRWIPGVPRKTSGSCWGALNTVFPCGLLPPNHELVTGTLRRIESNISKGGQPIHTGWMADGAWVAITLDNVAEVHLVRGNGDAAAKYLYSTLNHGTPLYTWCEERGQDPGTKKTSGDRQHLWTPVAVVRIVRDMLVMESGDGLNLGVGAAREWLASGKPVGVAGACTHFGPVSYQMQLDAARSQVNGHVTFSGNATAAWSVLHIRLPGGVRVKAVDAASKATVLPDSSGIRWSSPRGTMRFQATVGM